jgi:hypothetical protein
MTASQDWFPGADYPDREVWLKIRATPRKRRGGRYIHAHPLPTLGGPRPLCEPLVLGINATKRALDKIGKRSSLVKQRHAYYRRGANE